MRGKSLRTAHAAARTKVPNQVCGIGGNGDNAIAVFDFLKGEDGGGIKNSEQVYSGDCDMNFSTAIHNSVGPILTTPLKGRPIMGKWILL